MSNLTFSFNDEAARRLSELAAQAQATKAEIIRRSLAVYAALMEEKDTSDLAFLDKKTQKPKARLILPF